MRTAAELLECVHDHIEAARPRLEQLVRERHAGDQRMTELALEALEEEFAKIPVLVLEALIHDEEEELRRKERLH